MRRLFLLALAFACVACTGPRATLGPCRPTRAQHRPTLTPATTALPPIDLHLSRGAQAEFAAEVDRFAMAPQYQIDLTIAPDLSTYPPRSKCVTPTPKRSR